MRPRSRSRPSAKVPSGVKRSSSFSTRPENDVLGPQRRRVEAVGGEIGELVGLAGVPAGQLKNVRSVSAVTVPLWLARNSCVSRPSSVSQRRLAPASSTRWRERRAIVEGGRQRAASVGSKSCRSRRDRRVLSLWRTVKSRVTPGSSFAPPRTVSVPSARAVALAAERRDVEAVRVAPVIGDGEVRLVAAAGRARGDVARAERAGLGAHRHGSAGPFPVRVMMLMTPPTALEP